MVLVVTQNLQMSDQSGSAVTDLPWRENGIPLLFDDWCSFFPILIIKHLLAGGSAIQHINHLISCKYDEL